MEEIKVGDAIACREQETGQSGILYVDADRIWVEFVDFDRAPSVGVENPIHLHTAKGWVVSLFDNVDFSPSFPFWRRGEVGHVHRQRILSNLALAGETAWHEDDRAKSASFSLIPDCDFLWPKDIAAALAETSVDTEPNRTAFTLSIPGGRISLEFSFQSDPIRGKWNPSKPGFLLNFDAGIKTRDCLNKIFYLQDLFSLLSWKDVDAEGILVRRVGAAERSYSHRVLSVGLENGPRRDEIKTITLTPLSADDDAEREAMQGVLLAWFEKAATWQEFAGMIHRAQQQLTNVSAERALDACRWHELIERAQNRKAAAPDGMDKVIDAAISQAKACELEDYVDWIRSRLSGVRGEPQKALFPRLIREANERLGRSLFDEISVDMLIGAYKARNATGHGAMGPMSNVGVRNLWGNILAMEALCAARMMGELPFSQRGLKLLHMHPLFRAFKELQKERADQKEKDVARSTSTGRSKAGKRP